MVSTKSTPPVHVLALLDSGANSCFMDRNFAQASQISLRKLPVPTSVVVIDGRPIASGNIVEESEPIQVVLGSFVCVVSFNIISSPEHPIVLGLPWFELHNPDIDWRTREVRYRQLQESTHRVSTISLHQLHEEGHKEAMFLFAISVHPSSNIKEESLVQLPAKYHPYADVFDKVKAGTLPHHRPYDCPIDLQPGTEAPWGPIYNLSPTELEVLRAYIEENLANGFIRHSKSPAGAPIFFVKKKDGSLRLVVDYRGLNKVTIRNRYALPLISSLLERVNGAKFFTKIDLRGAYNLVRIRPGDEWKTAFRTRYGHFEYTVMPFGLTNAPAVFQHMANDIFRDLLDICLIIYLDDLLIYSKTQEEHDSHVLLVLKRLRENGLYAKLEKCSFDCKQVEFLGYVISSKGISMDPAKVKAVLEWQTPRSLRDVQCFLGFANFYRKFIQDYSKIILPLTQLTKKGHAFLWSNEADMAFRHLKEAFTSAPILAHVDTNKPFIMEADASDFALGSILSQQGDTEELHPVAFHSRKFDAAEINYEIHDKELLAIVDSFVQWRHFLEGSPHQVIVFSDHKNLAYFQNARVLNRRQARWAQFLTRFDFKITYRPGKQQGKADALSRRSYLAPRPGDPAFDNKKQVILGPTRLHTTRIFHTPLDSRIIDAIRANLKTDSFAQAILAHIDTSRASCSQSQQPGMDYRQFEYHDGLLFFKKLVYVPDGSCRLQIVQNCHDTHTAGHFGSTKTLDLVQRSFWWPHMRRFVDDYVRTCDACCRAKIPRHHPYGLLEPLSIPSKPWQSICLDFITDLPVSKGFDAILTVVDRYTKMAHFVPCTKAITSEETAALVMREVFRHHGLPDSIISDRGPQFVSKFWKHLFKMLKVSCNLSSGYHPQTDGQAERTNQTLEQYLRCFLSYQQDDWADILHFAEFAYNNAIHSSTRVSPFYAYTGSHPRWSVIDTPELPSNPRAEDHLERLRKIQMDLSTHLRHAQHTQKNYADRHRLPSSFAIGDRVWLLRRHIKTTRPCDKLDYRRLGPFRISGKVNDVTFRLDLPPHLRIHPVFHSSLLEPYKANTIPDRVTPPPPPLELDAGPEYEVVVVLDSKFVRNKLYYLVDWLGYSPSERTWEPVEHVANAQDLLADFHQQYPDKPGPQSAPTRSTRRLKGGIVS